MRDKLITYVDYLFAGAPETQKRRELPITLQFPESETFRKCWTKENSLRKIPPL